MVSDPDTSYRDYWVRTAQRLVGKVLWARFLQTFLPMTFWLSVPAAAGLLVSRNMAYPTFWFWLVLCVVIFTAAVWAYWKAWSYDYKLEQALVRLENSLGLHAKLSAAASGICAWPEPVDARKAFPRWNPSKLLLEPALTLVLVTFAFLCPLPAKPDTSFPEKEPPMALRTAQQMLEELAEGDVVESSTIEDLKKQIREILRQPDSQWYQHTSLEAADHLKNQIQSGIAELGAALQAAQSAIENPALLSNLSESQLRELQKALSDAANTLQSGPLPLDSRITQRLGGLQLSYIQSLSDEERQALLQQLREAQAGCESSAKCLSKSTGANAQANSSAGGLQSGSSSADGTTLLVDNTQSEEALPGSGSPQRGGGPQAPLAYNLLPTDLGTQNLESLPAPDLTRAGLGDLLQITPRAPKVNSDRLTTAGGAARTEGRGTGSTYEETFTPAERKALEKFYE